MKTVNNLQEDKTMTVKEKQIILEHLDNAASRFISAYRFNQEAVERNAARYHIVLDLAICLKLELPKPLREKTDKIFEWEHK